MQTITTKFYGPTNHKGARIKAETTSGVKLWQSWDYALNTSQNHEHAAKALKDKMQWKGKMEGGYTLSGMVFVFPGHATIK